MTPEALLGWVPHTVLAGLLYLFIKREVARLEKERDEKKGEFKAIERALVEIDKKMGEYATKEGLANLGARFDERTRVLSERLAVTEMQVRGLEQRK
jgi:hypothetical protein